MPKCWSAKIGDKFNYLEIRAFLPRKPNSPVSVLAKCDCGKLKVLELCNLQTERTKSCGCKYKKSTNINGVYYCKKDNKFLSYIFLNNKKYDLGYFSEIESAIEIRKKAEMHKINGTLDTFLHQLRVERKKKKRIVTED